MFTFAPIFQRLRLCGLLDTLPTQYWQCVSKSLILIWVKGEC